MRLLWLLVGNYSPNSFWEVATQPFGLLGVGEKELEGGK